MKKSYFTYQIIFSTRDIENFGYHDIILQEKLLRLNSLHNEIYEEMRVIGVLNELTFPDGNFLKKSIILLCECNKKEESK